MLKRPFNLFFLLVFCLAAHAFAEVPLSSVSISKQTEQVNVASAMLFYEDTTSNKSIDEIRALAGNKWTAIPDSNPNFGFTDSTIWLYFSVTNEGEQPLPLVAHIDYALLDNVEFFSVSPAGNGTSSTGTDTSTDDETAIHDYYSVGDKKPYNSRPIDFPTFAIPFSLNAYEQKEIFISIKTQGALQVPISLWQQAAFQQKAQDTSFLYGFFLGALLIMSAYYLCLSIIVRQKTYLLYSVYIICMVGVHSSLDGYAYKWLWPYATSWNQISAITFISIGIVSAIYFTRALLPLPSNGPLNNLTRIVGLIAIASAALTFFLPYQFAAQLNALMTVVVMSSVFVTCLAMLKRSPRIAQLFCWSWGAYFAGIIVKSLTKVGVLPSTLATEYGGNIGAMVGVVIIALALAEQINTERRKREAAKQEAINNLKRFEALYENALEGIFSLSDEGQLLEANPSLLKIIGLESVEQFNGNWLMFEGYRFSQPDLRCLLQAIASNKYIRDQEYQMTNSAGESIWVSISARAVHEQNGKRIEGTLVDISERKAIEQKLQHMAEHDPLTGFFNRRAFEQRTSALLSKVQSNEETGCILYLDLDQFKIVNDLCGHSAGDLLLQNLSKRLQEEVDKLGEHFFLARLGGDEFGILLSNTHLANGLSVAERVRETVEQFLFLWEGKRYSVGVSVGLVELLPYHHSVEQVLVMADTACYMAKDLGRNRVHVFIESDQDMQFRQLEMQWVNTIKEALEKDRFFLVKQNIAARNNTHNKTEVVEEKYHYEILIRLMNGNGNLCSPGQFLPAAERYNLMPNIDRWVINAYFAWLQAHPEHMEYLDCASINLSTDSIGDVFFAQFLIDAFSKYQIPAEKICFEITEGMAIVHLDNTQAFIKRFRDLGCRFALDDFGTGFSSYAYLKDLNVDYLKIDGVFVNNICNDNVSAAMVKSIHEVAKAIGIETIAEFVEDQSTLDKLTHIGIDHFQGYYVHKPVSLESNAENLKSNSP